MSQIALKKYLSHIEALLDENLLAEASAHCRFILEQYPRHVESYRFLGRALLEQEFYREALDVFYRVLGADPEDLVAWAGLAIAFRENGEFEKAIWHMDRAFEIDPYNVAIRDELGGLYEKHGKDRQLELTRPALARLYARGKLYALAIDELNYLLEVAPNRLDLKTLLAESYYWAGHRAEAINQCVDIVQHLPNCIKANAILAETWLKAGRESNAQPYIRRIVALTLPSQSACDSESLLGRALSAYAVDKLPDQMLVDSLDYVPAEGQDWKKTQQWAEGETIKLETEDSLPNWLGEIGDLSSESPIEEMDVVSDVESEEVWPDEIAEIEEIFPQTGKAMSSETGEPDTTITAEETIDLAGEQVVAFENEDQRPQDTESVPTFDAFEDEDENAQATTEDDLESEGILVDDSVEKGLTPPSFDEDEVSITVGDSFRDDLVRELESLSLSPEDEEWHLGDESVETSLFDSADELLRDFENDLASEGEVPDWLEQAVGRAEGDENQSDQERTESGRRSELSDELVPLDDDRQIESVQSPDNEADLDWIVDFGEKLNDIKSPIVDEDSGQDYSPDDLSEWLATIEREPELVEPSSDEEVGDIESVDMEDIPWLEELGDYSDDLDTQDKTSEDGQAN